MVNSLKELYLLKWDSSATEYKLGHRIILPKAVSHGYSENHRLYWFDRSGDIYSQSFDKLRESINNEATRNEICHDIVLETSNFCSLIDMKTGNLLGHEIVAFSDQYYKIRLIERADYHRMLMTISLRTRYAESLFIYKNSKLLVYYDDGKMQLLDDKEILHSANEDKYYVEHPFVGHLAFYTLPDSHNILVHCIDTDEVHLAELNEETLTLATLTKKSYHGEGIAHSEVALVGTDVLTGPMSGCWLVTYRKANGVPHAGHLGTDVASPAGTAAVNGAWNAFALAHPGDVIGGFNPLRHWIGPYPTRNANEPAIPPKIFGLYTTNNQYYIMVAFQQANPATLMRIAGIQQVASSPIARLQQVDLPGP